MPDLLPYAAHLPVIELAPGEVLISEGTRTGSIWVLESGSLRVTKSGAVISTVDRPGAVFGEVAVLLGISHSATVEAAAPSRLRYAQDGAALLRGDSDALFVVAKELAERLDFVTTYLADLKNQYGTAPGLAMVSDVLGRLSTSRTTTARTGSAREPDPEY